jgi:hypothetical protein
MFLRGTRLSPPNPRDREALKQPSLQRPRGGFLTTEPNPNSESQAIHAWRRKVQRLDSLAGHPSERDASQLLRLRQPLLLRTSVASC